MCNLPLHIAKLKGTLHRHLIFSSALTPVGVELEVNWPQFTFIMQTHGHEQVTDKKHAQLFSPWSPVPGVHTRKSQSVQYTSMLVFDLDKIDILDIDVVQSWCGNYAALLHTTFSHGVDGNGCFRIYVPLSKPVDADQYRDLHTALLAELPQIASRVDPSCADFSRCYFMPSCPPQRMEIAKTLFAFGSEVDVDMLLATQKPVATVIPTLPQGKATVHGQAPQIGSNVAPVFLQPPVTQGSRNASLVSELGRAYAKGFTPEAVRPVAIGWGLQCTPPMDAPEIESAVNSMWNTHTRNNPQHVPPVQPQRGRLVTADELLKLPPLTWLVKDLVPAKGLAVIYGQPGSGKSFVAMDMACAIAAGSPSWFGAKVKSAPVAYVVLEGASGMGQRLLAWQLHHRKPAPSNLRFDIGNFTLMTAADAQSLASEILEQLGPGAMVIVDTLNQSAPGADENSSVDMGKIISNSKLLAEAIGGLVVLIHHAGKDNSRGARGHSSLHAATDAVIEVVNTPAGRAWRATKVKDGELGALHGFELVSYVVGKDDDGDDVRSCAVRQALIGSQNKRAPAGKNQKLAMAAINALALHSGGVQYEDAKRAVAVAMPGPQGRRNSRAKEAVDGLIDAGLINQTGETLTIPNQ